MYKTFIITSVIIFLLLVQITAQDISENDVPEDVPSTDIPKNTQSEDVIPQQEPSETAESQAKPTELFLPSYLASDATNNPEPKAESTNSSTVTEQTNSTHKLVHCSAKMGSSEVEVVNGTSLIKLLMPDLNVTSKDTAGTCVVVLFFATFCPFSSMAAPHFNALPRAFPDIKMVAIDAMKYHFFNAQNGIGGVPTLFLFHNGRPVSKFNESEYTLELFSKFITKHTGIKAEEKSYVTSADFSGPVSSVPEKETDYYLGLSWAFIMLCSVYYFSMSKWWEWIVESVQITWRESEAQHEHTE